MKNKGITLISLIFTVIILGIIAMVTTYSGINTITASRLKRFQSEMEIIRLKCNELLEEGVTIEDLLTRGQDIATLSSSKLDKINNALQQVTNSTNTEGYVYFNSLGLQNLGIASVNREVIINFNDKVIIDINGVKVNNDEYIYTIEWTSNAVLATNVQVQSIALDNTSYTLTVGKTLTLTPIITPSNASNKKVTWTSSDETIATVAQNGVVTGIKTGTVTITAAAEDESITASCVVTVSPYINKPNQPKLAGMTPVKFKLPEGDTAGTTIITTAGDTDWYNYDEKKWANAKTKDGSMWVWIPRYAYRINSNTQTTEIVFLSGTSDNYYDASGVLRTAKRAKTQTDVVDTTTDFTVHPAFTNEAGIGYRNGGWDKELTGIWVAKFEAGYPSGNNTVPIVASNVKYNNTNVWVNAVERGDDSAGSMPSRNWLDGIYETEETAIKYPTFQPLTYSMNYINHSDAYLLSKDMVEEGNIYGFSKNTTDAHLMKNSEWGAIAYLSKSQYGLQSTDIAINNINMNSGGSATTKEDGNVYASVYGITGVTQRK